MPIPRKTIDELVTLYELEPQLRDVFVEGPSDRDLLAWYLHSRGKDYVDVADVDAVDVPAASVTACGLTTGRRSCVIALATILAQRHVSNTQALCVIDRDFDDVLGRTWTLPHLVLTDFATIEGYLMDPGVVEKFLHLRVGVSPATAASLLVALRLPVRYVYLLRAANESLGLHMAILDIADCCEVDDVAIDFTPDGFLGRCLDANAARTSQRDLIAEIQRLDAIAIGDPRMYANGADFLSLVGLYVRKTKAKARLGDADAVKRAMFLCVEAAWLAAHPLFQRIDAFAG